MANLGGASCRTGCRTNLCGICDWGRCGICDWGSRGGRRGRIRCWFSGGLSRRCGGRGGGRSRWHLISGGQRANKQSQCPGLHQRWQRAVFRERQWVGLYRSGHPKNGWKHQLQHQRWCRFCPIQHRQQQRVVSFVSSPDFEVSTDAGSNSVYDLVISATESGNTFVATRSVAVTVQDWRCGPRVQQRQQRVVCRKRHQHRLYRSGRARCDRCGGVIQHQRRCRLGQFSINSSSGVVRFVSSPNFEAPIDAGGNNVYDLVSVPRKTATLLWPPAAWRSRCSTWPRQPRHSAAATAPALPRTPPARFIPQRPAPMWQGATSHTASAVPMPPGSASTATVVWWALSAAELEVPTDSGGNNVYDIIIRATEVGNTFVATRSVAVTVTDVGDVAPVFTQRQQHLCQLFRKRCRGGLYRSGHPDVTGAVVSYSISGGLDSARFSVNSSSGVVRFVNQPDYEIPADFDGNNSYQFVYPPSRRATPLSRPAV